MGSDLLQWCNDTVARRAPETPGRTRTTLAKTFNAQKRKVGAYNGTKETLRMVVVVSVSGGQMKASGKFVCHSGPQGLKARRQPKHQAWTLLCPKTSIVAAPAVYRLSAWGSEVIRQTKAALTLELLKTLRLTLTLKLTSTLTLITDTRTNPDAGR